MKKIEWKTLMITCAVCLLPILFGVIFYEKLPEIMPIHFNMNNEPNGFAKKDFALFGLPALMAVLQVFCCIITDINGEKKGSKPKFVAIIQWIIPILSVVISVITIEIPLGSTVDVRKSVLLVLGILFMMIGNYMPKMSYEQMQGKMHPMPKDEKTYRKVTRMLGYTFVIFGLLFLISIAFTAIVSWVVIVLLVVILLIECAWSFIKNR